MNLDGLKRLLGMATKGAGQVGKAAGQAAGGAARLMGKPLGKLAQPLKPMAASQMAPMMARDGSPMPTTNFGPRANPRMQEDDGMVWGPRGMQPLSAMRQGEPWQNAQGQAPRPTMFDQQRFNPTQFDVPVGFPVPGGSNTPRLYEDGSYGRDTRGGLEMPQGMPGVRLYEDGSYADRRPRY